MAAAGVFSGAGVAQPVQDSVTGTRLGTAERFGSYEDNFVVWNRMQNNGWARADDKAFRGHYSFKYAFCGPRLVRGSGHASVSDKDKTTGFSLCPTSGLLAQAEVFAVYTGEFDFYAGSRPSGPVINRISAPGLFVRLPATWLFPSWKPADGLEVGVQHRSDGQTTEVTSSRDARIAGEAYAAGNVPFFDTISRGANFISVAADLVDVFKQPIMLRAKLRSYLGTQDSAVTWGPRANLRARFSDYDRLQLTATYSFTTQNRVDLEWRVGDRGLATDSWTLGWNFSLADLPFYLRLHQGPMNTLSNYTQRQDSIGFGLRFASF